MKLIKRETKPLSSSPKKKQRTSSQNSANQPQPLPENITNIKKKKIKIGFKTRKEEKTSLPQEKQTQHQHHSEDELDYLTEEEPSTPQTIEKQAPKKKKSFLQKNMKGVPIYLEDTGEKLGTVFDTVTDNKKSIIGYKIKDNKTGTILSFSTDQFDEDKNGLIFIPSWYTKATQTLNKLEFKDRISPELTTLLIDNAISHKELYNIFVKHDDEMALHMQEASALKEILQNHLKILQTQRLALKDNLMNLTEKRLIKDIDRREFSEDVQEHRRRVNILDVNINKCKELLERLDKTSFGMINNKLHILPSVEHPGHMEKQSMHEKKSTLLTENIESPYKKQYYDIKERYTILQEEYTELKNAVEKLIEKQDTLM